MMRILVLGAGGMLGNAVLRYLSTQQGLQVTGTVRSHGTLQRLPPELRTAVRSGVDVEQFDSLAGALTDTRPDVVINCVGVVKQLAQADDPLTALPINSMLPHRLATLCKLGQARLIHISTDCVFSGSKGLYRESDHPDAEDLYGRSKLLGEVGYAHTITLRTSIIGHELDGSRSLLNWFLAQEGRTRGYTRAVFSGLPTVELAHVIAQHVLPQPQLHGLYHVSAEPINKYDLLTLVAKAYGKHIVIDPVDTPVIDRSLDSTRFREATGYVPPDWPELVRRMEAFR
jgi:dTDP-4-dehydrorhamnose reductase